PPLIDKAARPTSTSSNVRRLQPDSSTPRGGGGELLAWGCCFTVPCRQHQHPGPTRRPPRHNTRTAPSLFHPPPGPTAILFSSFADFASSQPRWHVVSTPPGRIGMPSSSSSSGANANNAPPPLPVPVPPPIPPGGAQHRHGCS